MKIILQRRQRKDVQVDQLSENAYLTYDTYIIVLWRS